MNFEIGDVVCFKSAAEICNISQRRDQMEYIKRYGTGPFMITKVTSLLCYLTTKDSGYIGGYYHSRLEKIYDFIDD